MGHKNYVPPSVNWFTCEKCGEPKRQHRICTTHLEVCALKPEDWIKYKLDHPEKFSQAATNSTNTDSEKK